METRWSNAAHEYSMWSADEDENRAEVLTKLSSRTGTVRACDLG